MDGDSSQRLLDETVQKVQQSNENHTSDDVDRILHQIDEIYKEKGHIWDTYFYKVVIGGNVELTKRILDLLRGGDCQQQEQWLLQTAGKSNKHPHQFHKTLLAAQQCVIFSFFSLLMLVLTPVFYACHSFTTALLTRKMKRLSAEMKLPIAYAAFCCDADMVQLFLHHGVDIEQVDDDDNNVFHYIGDISSVAPEKAIEMFEITVKFIQDEDDVQRLICHHGNSAGMSALEYTAQYGSPALLTVMLNHPMVMLDCEIAVAKDKVCFDENKTFPHKEYTTKLNFVDVTMFEAGPISKRSAILNLLSDRYVPHMSLADNALYDKCAFVGKWMALKSRQMIVGIATCHLFDIVATILLVLIIATISTITKTVNQTFSEFSKFQIEEMKAQANDSSIVLKNVALKRLSHEIKYAMELNFVNQILSDQTITDKLSEFQNFNSSQYDSDDDKWEAMDDLFDSSIKSKELEEYSCNFVSLKYLLVAKKEFTIKVFDETPLGQVEKIDISNREWVENLMKSYYNNFTIPRDGCNISLASMIDYSLFQNFICFPVSEIRSEDVHNIELLDIVDNETIDIFNTCGLQVVYNLASGVCKYKGGHSKDVAREFVLDWDEELVWNYHANRLSGLVTLLYLILDILERLVFTYTCVASHKCISQMFNTALSKKVPGSYARKQLNVLTHFMVFCSSVAQEFELGRVLGLTYEEGEEYRLYLLIVVMILRFVLHIHSMRLLPGLGHFVNTTFMMGTNLVHFSAIYGIVLFVFGVVFHIIVDDVTCPLKKADGFGSIHDSMFSIFKVTFGHGNFDVFYTSSSVKLTYALFVIISGLLFMNLIVAIMSTTATAVMCDPWRSTLWRLEWLDEALAVELTTAVLTAPMPRGRGRHWLHRAAGYTVKQTTGARSRHRIYIKVFHCPALHQ